MHIDHQRTPPKINTMLIGAPPSSSPLVANAVASHHFNIQFGRLGHLKCGQLKYRKIVNKNHTGFNLQQIRKAKFVTNAAPEYSQNAQDSQVLPQIDGKSFRHTFDVLYRFSRFFTLKGSVLGAISSSLLAIQSLSDFTPSFFRGLLLALIGVFFANSFVMSINQVTDLEIDKINKPHLPLVTGELSVKSGILFTVMSVVLGLCVILYVPSWPLRLCLSLWYALGFAYSVDLPLLRWKSKPFLTVMAIWLLRGLLIPILFYLHTQVYIFGRPLLLSKHVIFSSGLLTIFNVVIPLFKDIPDVDGDSQNGIKTFALRYGQARIFWICIWLLEIAYGIAIFIGLSSTRSWIRAIMVMSHIILGFLLWKNANMVDLKSKKDIYSSEMFIWKLCYVEYLLLPVLRF